MNGQLILLLLTLLLQGQNGAVLPPGAGELSRGLASAPTGSSECDIGYATDPIDGKYCMIVQIHPSAIAVFARGDYGSELPVPIRGEYRNFVEKVIIRVGTGPVESVPPSALKMSENRSNNPAYLADLKVRTPVNIDRNSDLVNASSQSGLGPSGLGSNDPGVFPPSDKTRAAGVPGVGNGNTNTGVMPPSSIMPNSSSPFPSNNRTSELDNFGAPPGAQPYPDDTKTKQQYYNPLKQTQPLSNSGNVASPYQPLNNPSNNQQGSTYPSNGNNFTGSNYGTGPNVGNNSAGINNGLGTNGGQGNSYPAIASNPNPNAYNPNPQASPFSNSPTSLTQNQNFGASPSQQPSYGAVQYQPPVQPPPSFAGTPNGDLRSSSSLGGNRLDGTTHDDQNVGRESMLPFLLLFSIVGNVYLGLWMNHLRKRYRELRISMRGLPVSELA